MLQEEIIATIVSLLDGEIERAEQLRLRDRNARDLGWSCCAGAYGTYTNSQRKTPSSRERISRKR